MTLNGRWWGWWHLAVAAGERLTQPRSDIVGSDLEVERLLTNSFPSRALEAIEAAFEGARADAALIRILRPIAAEVQSLSPVNRARAAGLVAAGSAMVALLARAVAGGFRPWPDAVLPAVAAAAGLLVAALADPLVRARIDKRS